MALLLLLLSILASVSGVQAQGWTEPTISGELRTGPYPVPPVTGSTFYVDGANLGGTCNNANPGTLTQPWCTLAKAMTTLTAGQRAYIRAHTYNEGMLVPSSSGTAGNYIHFEAYPGDAQPVLNCVGHQYCINQDTTAGATARSYIVINGLNIHSPNQSITLHNTNNSQHWWFVNSKIHDTDPPPINPALAANCLVLRGSFNMVSNNEIYNCAAAGVGLGGGGSAPFGGQNIAEFNIFHDNGRHVDDEGAIKCSVFGYGCVLRYNIGYNNYRDIASPVACAASPCLGITAFYHDFDENITRGFGTTSYMHNNIAHDNDTGLQVFRSERVRVFNNLTYHNGFTPGDGTFGISNFGHGLFVGDNVGSDIQVYNNTSYDNRQRGIHLAGIAASELILRNNIVMNNDINVSHFFASTANFNYDLINAGRSGTAIIFNGVSYASLAALRTALGGGNTTWINAVGTSATFVNAATGNFHLQSGSAGINQGTVPPTVFNWDLDNVSRPQGGAWDIGAYDFVVAASSPPTVTITAPTSGTTHSQSTTPLTTLAGSAADDVGVTNVTWACPTCSPTSGTATCGTCGAAATSVSWSVSSIGLAMGDNVITVSTTDADTQTGTDVLTVTLTGAADITSNLVAHWKFDENTGTTPQDSAGTNHGTFVSTPTWVSPGKLGLAMLDFDGTGDRVDVGNGAALNPTGNFTMAAWVRTDLATTTQNFLTKNVADTGNQYSLQWRSNQRVRCTAPNSPQVSVDSNTTLTVATWYHIACVYNGTDVRLYTNGVLDSTPAAATGSAAANGQTVLIGSSRNASPLPFDGQLDDVRLYARALSATDVAALAALTNPPTITITTDCGSGAGNDCTVNTTPLTTLAGTWTDDGAVTISVSCSPSCGSPTVTCAACGAAGTSAAWNVASLPLTAGVGNVITVSILDANNPAVTDQITVTYIVVVPPSTSNMGLPHGIRLVR